MASRKLRLQPCEPVHGRVDPAVDGGRWGWCGRGDVWAKMGARIKDRQVLGSERSALVRWGHPPC